MLPESVDVLIIGAGPAGCAAAAILRQEGLSPVIVEKGTFPRFVIGESLLPRCMALLKETGLYDAVAARDYQVKTGAEFLRGDERCSFDFSDQFSDGPGWTWQVPRADFDQTLAREVAATGVPVCFDHTVTAVDFEASPRVTVRLPDGRERVVRARYVIDASGYGRVLPRLLDLDVPSALPVRHALFTWVRGDLREPDDLGGRTWVALHPRGAWIWVIPFSNGHTSVGVVAQPDFFEGWPEDPTERFLAIVRSELNLSRRLAGASLTFEPILNRGFSIGVKQLHGDAWCLVGNASEFLDPVFSSGVTLALESAVTAARCVARQLRGETVDWDQDYDAHLMHGVEVFRTYVDAWYSGLLPRIFFAPDPPPMVRRQVCSVLSGEAWDRDNPFVARHAAKAEHVAQVP